MYKISKFLILAIAIVVLVIAPFLCSKAQEPSGGTLNYPGSFKLFTTKFDTTRVVMLVCDTSHYFSTSMEFYTCEQVGCKDTTSGHKMFVSHFKEVPIDRGVSRKKEAYWAYGYSVREFSGYFNRNTTQNDIYISTPFYQHIEYMGEDKKPLQYKIVWMAKEIN